VAAIGFFSAPRNLPDFAGTGIGARHHAFVDESP
jgi:hypothetical protein